MPVNYPQGSLSTTAQINSETHYENFVKGNELFAFNRMSIFLTLQSNEAINPITALHNARGNLASHIASDFIFNLEQAYLGKQDFKTNSYSDLDEDKIKYIKFVDVA